MKSGITKLHYKKNLTLLDFIVLLLLLPASFVYACVVGVRAFLYKIKILRSYKAEAYTISVGNLTTGGVGKTPIVKELANFYISRGEKVAILSRGYGGKLSNKNINVISDGNEILHNAADAGDEPYWLALNCPKCVVLTSKDRAAAAKYAVKKFGCTKLILDDGYQYMRLKRDLNILITDYEKRFGNNLPLPAGPLRELKIGIKRADKIIVVNKTANVTDAENYCKELENKYKKSVTLANMEFDFIYSLTKNVNEIVTQLIKQGTVRQRREPMNKTRLCRVLAFCAIAQPQQFFNQLEENGHEVAITKIFDDHHLYTKEDLDELNRIADSNNVDYLITTEKDGVKIKELLGQTANIKRDLLIVKLQTNFTIEGLADEQKTQNSCNQV